MPVRVRFAPSPTGYLHVGGARTALFNWLFARREGGKFLLRIEDTDKARSTDEHTQVILDGLTWLGLDWDEPPVFQGARLARHQQVADQLLKEGKAYMEEEAIRLRVPPGELSWEDAVHGRISFKGEDIRDFVILRSDRSPLYNFAVVVDDIDMQITHVVRGDDHISNTPKQLAVYRALSAATPVFGHVPMIHGPDGKKLSKRHGATAVGDYEHFGILPGALRNYLALLGWSPGQDREIFFELQELIDVFSLDGILKKSAVFDMVKLQWMNSLHMRHKLNTRPQDLTAEVIKHAPELEPFSEQISRVLPIVVSRASTTTELAAQMKTRVDSNATIELGPKAREYFQNNPDGVQTLKKAAEKVASLSNSAWVLPTTLEPALKDMAASLGKPPGEVFQPLRIVVSGSTVSEPVHELLWAIGRETSLKRMVTFVHAWPNVPSTGGQTTLTPPSAGFPKTGPKKN